MGAFDIFKISASGMKAQRKRMDIVASNLANVQTTSTEEGGAYRKKDVVFKAVDVSDDKTFSGTLSKKVEGVEVEDVKESDKPFQMVYNPSHPDANSEGYVTFPNVNLMEEMTDMTAAARAYEANVNVLNTTKDMFLKTLELIK
ncbi:MAG: Flagellar basal-body rod protein FlgC [Syntrophorhabdus sp. PtaB.Bin047]|jgi:flagellar basal-body rod protein FlgC|nr:MAG: Flagellar basal-body rod protein FlgC [Syntrophorhabdus sp. PtaB.Bin047]